ncbi:MAG: PAS domain S-box protein, partial [Methanoregulaceae archaeon]|nr:PAS domain S-box protein [Methanoregulaceae archaeon]
VPLLIMGLELLMMQDYQLELDAIKGLLKENPAGMSVTDLSRALNKNKNTVGRYLDILLISGQVEMRTYGMAKVYTLSQRVPLSAMLSYSKELIMVLDQEFRIIEINENFLTLLKLSRDSTIGKNIAFIKSPEVDVHELLDNLSAINKQQEQTVTFHLRDAGVRIFSLKCIPTVFEDGGKGLTVILEDITEHILSEREMRESEERFRMMAENIRDGLIILENDTCVFANRRVTEISGYSFEKLWKMDVLEIVAPEDRISVQNQIQSFEGHKGGPEEIKVWIIRKDGSRRYVYSRISQIQHHEKVLTYIILTDITDLKRKEDALMESEERFRTMAEHIHDGLVIIENETIVYVSRRMSEITGFDPEEMRKEHFLDIVLSGKAVQGKAAGSDDQEKIVRMLRTIRTDSDQPGEATFWITHKDGTPRCIHVNVTATERNGISSIYVTATDITSYTVKENALRDHIASLQEFLS